MFKDYDNFRTSDQIITKALNKFWIFSRQSLVRTSGPVLTKVQSEFAKVKTKKVTKRVVSFLESLRAPSKHVGARR